jgi:hypothetical protein
MKTKIAIVVLGAIIGLASPLQAQFVYVANLNTISAYSIDNKTGALTPAPGRHSQRDMYMRAT